MTSTKEKITIMIASAFVLALVAIAMVKSAKAIQPQPPSPTQPQSPIPPIQLEGKIINTETHIIGDCINNNCYINKDLLIYSTFKNIGSFTKTNQIEIQIDNKLVKTETVTLNPDQEYYMMHTTTLDTEKLYNVCGIVIE